MLSSLCSSALLQATAVTTRVRHVLTSLFACLYFSTYSCVFRWGFLLDRKRPLFGVVAAV